MPALNLIFRSGSNRVFGCACSLFLAVAIALFCEPSRAPATQCRLSEAAECAGIHVQSSINSNFFLLIRGPGRSALYCCTPLCRFVAGGIRCFADALVGGAASAVLRAVAFVLVVDSHGRSAERG